MLSKDSRFENDGIGPQTQIRYGADFQYYKRRLTESYHSANSSHWVQTLLATWDREVFFHHNKRKGLTVDDENTETIDIVEDDVDGNEITEGIEHLRLWSEAQANAPNTDPGANSAAGPGHNSPPARPTIMNDSDHDDFDDIYGDEAPPIPTPAVPAVNLSTPCSSSDSDASEPQNLHRSKSLPLRSELSLKSNNNTHSS